MNDGPVDEGKSNHGVQVSARSPAIFCFRSLENLVPPGMYIDYLPQLVNPIVSISNFNELVHQSWSMVICKPVDLEEVFPRYPKNIAEEDVFFSFRELF